jgi:TPR repeat protein
MSGHTDAQNELALLLLNQLDSANSRRLAVKWLRQAANQGNQYAQYNLARIYLNELSEYQVQFPVDFRQAARWLEKASANGHVLATRMLANLYKNGMGIDANPKKALLLLDDAAAAGDAVAMFEMAIMIESGVLGVKDDSKVFILMDKAAHAGHAEARKWLAEAYTDSKLIPQNNFRSFVWYVLYLNKDFSIGESVGKARDQAIKQCQQVEDQLSDKELKAAKQVVLGLFESILNRKQSVFDKRRTSPWSQEHVAELENKQFKDLVHGYFNAQQRQMSCQ